MNEKKKNQPLPKRLRKEEPEIKEEEYDEVEDNEDEDDEDSIEEQIYSGDLVTVILPVEDAMCISLGGRIGLEITRKLIRDIVVRDYGAERILDYQLEMMLKNQEIMEAQSKKIWSLERDVRRAELMGGMPLSKPKRKKKSDDDYEAE